MKKKYTSWTECLELNEIKALVGLRHPNIVTLKELILTEKEELNLIFEYVNMNLYEFMTKNNREIPEIKIRNIIFQVLQGLNFMHKQNFFHRDMKPENILVNEDQVKIADFGLARELNNKSNLTDYVATRWYRSPEVILKSKNYHSPIDIFALGAIMAELYNKRPLFPGKNEHEQIYKICEVLGTPIDWTEGINLASKIGLKFPSSKALKLKNIIPRASDSALNLLQSMLNFDPEKRPSAAQCLQHPFFQSHELLPIFIFSTNQSHHYKNKANDFLTSSQNRKNSSSNKNYVSNFSKSANNLIGLNNTQVKVIKQSENSSKKNSTQNNTTLKMNSNNNHNYQIGYKKQGSQNLPQCFQNSSAKNYLEISGSSSLQNKY
jgi:protein kinase